MPQDHHIDKHRIEISAGKSANINQISKEIQDSKEETLRLIEQIFDKYIPADRTIEINRISLDLGSLADINFKQEYQRRLVSLLEAELKKLSKSQKFHDYVRKAPVFAQVSVDRFELLSRFFFKGYEPTLQKEPGFDISQLVKECITSDEQRFIQVMTPLWVSTIAKKRMQYQLRAPVFDKVRALMQNEAAKSGKSLASKDVVLLKQYFEDGTWPLSHEGHSSLNLELIFNQLNYQDRKLLTTELFKLISNSTTRTRLARSLSFKSLKNAFSGLEMLRQTIKELAVIEREMGKKAATNQFLSLTTFKIVWLEYLSQYRHHQGRAKILIDLMHHQVPGFLNKEELIKKIGQIKEAATLVEELKRIGADRNDLVVHNDVPPSAMDLFIRFLESGLLHQGSNLDKLLSGLLGTHSILLEKMLREKWHLYPVRYRIAHQVRHDHLIQVIQLLFGDSRYLAWLEEMFDTETVDDVISDLPEKIRRDLYFSFFEVIAGSFQEEMAKKQFYEQFTVTLVHVMPGLDIQELFKISEDKGYEHVGRHIIKILNKDKVIVEKKRDVKTLLHELITEGTTSAAYMEQFKAVDDWQRFFEEVIIKGELSVHLFLPSKVHDTFWSEVLPALKSEHLEKMTLQVATFQKATVVQVLEELQFLEEELKLEMETPGVFYPLAKDTYVVLLKALAKSKFSMSTTQLAHLMYGEVFARLKKERSAVVYERLARNLSQKAGSPVFKGRHRHISGWLEKFGKKTFFDQIMPKSKGGTNGIKEAYQDQYNTADLFLFYLERNSFPVWSSLKSVAEFKFLLEQSILNFEPDLIRRLRFAVLDKTIAKRLVQLLKPATLGQLLGARHYETLTIEDLLKWASQTGSSGTLPIKEAYLGQYNTTDLLLFYLEKNSFPVWSSLKSVAEFKFLLEQSILNYEPDLIRRLRFAVLDKRIAKRLVQLLKPATLGQLLGSRHYETLTIEDVLKWASQTGSSDTSPIKEAYLGQYNTTDLLLFYLEKNSFPVWSSLKSVAEFKFLLEQSILNFEPDLIRRLRFAVLDKTIAKRLVQLLKPATLGQLLGSRHYETLTIEDLLKWASQTGSSDTSPIKEAYLGQYDTADLLLFYLEKNSLPDWSSLKNVAEVKFLLEQAAINFEPDFIKKLRYATLEDSAAKRLISLLKPATLGQLLRYVDSRKYEVLKLTIEDLLKWAGLKKLFKASPGEIEEFLQLNTLTFILKGTSDADETNIKDLLRAIAREYKLPYHQLLAAVQSDSALFKSQPLKNTTLKEYDIIRNLHAVKWRKSGVRPSATDKYSAADVISVFLINGVIPKWSVAKNENDIKQLLEIGLKSNLTEVMEMVFQLSDQAQAVLRFADLLKIADKKTVLKFLLKNQWLQWETVLEDLLQFQKLGNFINDSETAFKHNVYTAVLQTLIAKKKGYQQDRELMASLLDAIILRYHLQSGNLYLNLIDHYTTFRSDRFKAFVKAYSADEAAKNRKSDWKSEGISTDFHGEYTSRDLILYYLKTSAFPQWSVIKSKPALRELFKKGIEVAITDVLDIVKEIQDDDFAGSTLVSLVNDQELENVLKRVNSQKFQSYRPIADDLLNMRGFVDRLSIKPSDWKNYLKLLLLSEVSSSGLHYSSEKFTVFILEQTARKFSLELGILYNILEENLNTIKSRPLKKAINDWRSQKQIQIEVDDTTPSLTADIDALLYILAQKSIPWWYIKRTKKSASVKTETQRLYKLLLHDHFNDLIEAVQNSGRETFYLAEIFKSITLNEFNRIVSAVVPGVSGFVIMYTRVLETLSAGKFSSLSFKAGSKVYTYIYLYIRSGKSGFTASVFTREVSKYVADYLKIDFQELVGSLLDVTELMIEKGEPKFRTLNEILLAVRTTPVVEKSSENNFEIVYEERASGSTEDFAQSLAHYLAHGSMPFRSGISSNSENLNEFNAYADSNPLKLKSVLTSALSKEVAVERILHHGPGLILRIAVFMYNMSQDQVEAWLKGIVDFMHSSYPEVAKSKYEALGIQVLLKSMSSPNLLSFDQIALTKMFLARASAALVPQLMKNLDVAFKTYRPAAQVSKVFVKALQKVVSLNPETSSKRKEKFPENELHTPLEGQLQVHNAGAVILANFLPRYFDMLGMTSKKVFHDQKTAARAVHLVQFLVTGKNETPEHELALIKVLCGVDLAYPVELSIDLTPKEIEISESLLRGVMQNWSKLKSTSIEALRDGFLMRKGYLNETPHNWELEVEESGRDILLDYLPWSFNTIKLSWMQKSLNVQWRK